MKDYFSIYVVLFPCYSATAKALIKYLEQDILFYGAPQYLTYDNGSQMKSFVSLCYKSEVKIFYPLADFTERVNHIDKTILSSYVQQDNDRTWENELLSIACATRTSRHEITDHTPYFINVHREHRVFGLC